MQTWLFFVVFCFCLLFKSSPCSTAVLWGCSALSPSLGNHYILLLWNENSQRLISRDASPPMRHQFDLRHSESLNAGVKLMDKYTTVTVGQSRNSDKEHVSSKMLFYNCFLEHPVVFSFK